MALPNPDKKVFNRDVCMTCKGLGILNGGGLKPSVACSNCHGSGKVYYQEEELDCDRIDEINKKLSELYVKNKEDMVNHPKHYTFGTIEVIDVIEDWQLGFHEGNCVKYIARAKHKGNELEDLRKAKWYLDRKIKDIELEIAAKDDE
jgi:hypothetical protein